MTDKPQKIDVRLRVLSQKAPGKHEGRATDFGLQPKKDRTSLMKGQKVAGGLAFDITASVMEVDGAPRFYGPWINGPASGQILYVTWHWRDDHTIISRLKVALAMPWSQVQRAHKDDKILVADGTEPQWGVLKNWHGLGVGSTWTLVSADN